MPIVGYFAWKRLVSGKITCEVREKEIRDWKMRSPNKNDAERYNSGLIQEVPLQEDEWRLPLAQLAELYPCPRIDDASERSNESELAT